MFSKTIKCSSLEKQCPLWLTWRMLFPKHSFPAQDSVATNEENTASTSVECSPLFTYRKFILQWEEARSINEFESAQVLSRGKL